MQFAQRDRAAGDVSIEGPGKTDAAIGVAAELLAERRRARVEQQRESAGLKTFGSIRVMTAMRLPSTATPASNSAAMAIFSAFMRTRSCRQWHDPDPRAHAGSAHLGGRGTAEMIARGQRAIHVEHVVYRGVEQRI